ncbi:TonB-dependent receptor [Thalassotalea marina]|uniref:Oar protein n=1 Tax=Thalassotalea marina TaxID=1673741 RepID=A0A919BK76_9GAMM|nr:TonB-dependent receptor [Thalassotalea marina]GHF96139.1 Oar protein [Thalassotalea marina]
MKNNHISKLAFAVALSLGAAVIAPANAAEKFGVIQGTVSIENSEAGLAGANITILNKSNGFTKSLTADENGEFRLSQLPVGVYTITITQNGYEKFVNDNVVVTIGKTSKVEVPMYSGDIEKISVTGSRVTMIDTTTSTSSLNITAVELDLLPVNRDITSIALLAEGTVKGDVGFGNLASFGGSSVAENAYFVNGLNVTDFRKGLGGVTVPHTAYAAHEVKSGGYGAQFGKSTGGVLSSVTQSGSNEFKFGANLRYTPDSERHDDLLYPSTIYSAASKDKDGNQKILNNEGDNRTYTGFNHSRTVNAEIWASGPIIEDTLFFYALYNHRDRENRYADRFRTNPYLKSALQRAADDSKYADELYADRNYNKNDDPHYFLSLDWFINADHSIKLWRMDTRSDNQIRIERDFYNLETVGNEAVGTPFKSEEVGYAYNQDGGYAWAANYDGHLTEDLTISVMYGEVLFNNRSYSENDETCPYVYSWTTGRSEGCQINSYRYDYYDKRKQYQLNGEWYINSDHLLRFGYDVEDNNSFDTRSFSGGVFYGFHTIAGGVKLRNGYTPAENMDVVQRRYRNRGGNYGVKSSSWYLDHQWQATDNIMVSLGLRNETFENENPNGDVFLKADNQWSPRIGVAWDINGDGESKAWFNMGRYFLPVASNTNVRLAGGELWTTEYFTYTGREAGTNAPILGEKLGDTYYYDDGEVPDKKEVVDQSIDPMYQDEIIIGYQQMLNEDWSASIKLTHRRLQSVVDDVGINYVLDDMGWVEPTEEIFVLTNPGSTMHIDYDTDGDGTRESVVIPGNVFGFEDPKRHYNSVALTLKRGFNDDWMGTFSYVWSQSYGNAEGAVKTDNVQADPGLTRDWDSLAIMDGANGYLPNDRRHVFKAYGAYQITDNLTVGLNATIQSGIPRNKFGRSYFPDPDGYHGGPTYWNFEEFNPRGSVGRTPWTRVFDLSLNYKLDVYGHDLNLKWKVYNVLNSDTTTRYVEFAEKGSGDTGGFVNELYGEVQNRLAARSMRFELDFKF